MALKGILDEPRVFCPNVGRRVLLGPQGRAGKKRAGKKNRKDKYSEQGRGPGESGLSRLLRIVNVPPPLAKKGPEEKNQPGENQKWRLKRSFPY